MYAALQRNSRWNPLQLSLVVGRPPTSSDRRHTANPRSRPSYRSHWLSVGLALLALALALRVRPLAWMLVLCLVPVAILIGAAPRLLGFERDHPRITRLCRALHLLGYVSFVVAVVLHRTH